MFLQCLGECFFFCQKLAGVMLVPVEFAGKDAGSFLPYFWCDSGTFSADFCCCSVVFAAVFCLLVVKFCLIYCCLQMDKFRFVLLILYYIQSDILHNNMLF
ncbi:hypothetical protein Patl1_33100 [Pistacia atlantica]|uniref:Uncharacterized protein n=1 Tax=Pistacia atlantica TaxID=434234 RepID=A0ACC1ANR4_9ROSI|nr:hypothetical protein Patl1_33100 [Pistacia atlantica]